MKNLLFKRFIIAILSLALLNVQPAEASMGHVLKKALWLPVYMVFSHVVAAVAWLYFADEPVKVVPKDDPEEEVF